MDRRRLDRPGRARPGRARNPDHAVEEARQRCRARDRTAAAKIGPAPVSLARNGGIVVSRTLDEAIALTQRMAPEHLVCDSDAIARRTTRAGTVFVGDYSAQACGDYVTGSNHVLPTSGAAAGRGGLSAADFVRVSTVQRLTAAGLRRIAPAGVALARAEGLTAHAASMTIRDRRIDGPRSSPKRSEG